LKVEKKEKRREEKRREEKKERFERVERKDGVGVEVEVSMVWY